VGGVFNKKLGVKEGEKKEEIEIGEISEDTDEGEGSLKIKTE
jgi:hypothetical protein